MILFAEHRHVKISLAVKDIIDRINTAAENFAREHRRSLQQLKSMVRVDGKRFANLLRSKRFSLLIPDITRLYFPDVSSTDQFFKIPSGIGKYLRSKLADIRKKSLSIESPHPGLMKHQMIDRSI